MKHLLRLSLAILLTACTLPAGEYSVSVHVPGPIVWGQTPTPPKATPVPTFTPTPPAEPSPTQEANATIVFPTPAPDRFVVYVVTAQPNLRSSPGIGNNKIRALERGELVEFDPQISVSADGYVWRQVWSHPDGVLLGWTAENWLEPYRA